MGGRDAGRTFLDSVTLASRLVNLGDAKTSVTHPASTTHAQLAPEALLAAGRTPVLLMHSYFVEDRLRQDARLARQVERLAPAVERRHLYVGLAPALVRLNQGEALIKEFGIYPPGCCVRLKSGEVIPAHTVIWAAGVIAWQRPPRRRATDQVGSVLLAMACAFWPPATE